MKTLSELREFGIINVDKPAGMTSFDVVDAVRKKLKLRKASHFGTLDPMVTGVLPIALNRAVKLTGFFIRHDKEYVGEMRIHQNVEIEKIKEMIEKKFLGKIIQLPPVKSRVKRQEREREIMKFEILEKKENVIKFRTEVEGGTYIRKLVHDLGQALGVGAHMIQLRRVRAGIFHEKESVKLEEIDENFKKIIPAEDALKKIYPVVQIKEENLKKIFTGKPIHTDDLKKKEKFEKGEIVSIFAEDKFVGMYEIKNEGEVFAKAKFVKQDLK